MQPSSTQPQVAPLDPTIINMAKAIRQTESQGNFQARGKSGEFGAYQFMPTTWQPLAKKYLGQDVPIEQATPEQQNEVAYKRISDLKSQGFNVGQVASVWNSGSPEWEGKVGVNSRGVRYDVPSYVNKVNQAYQQLKPPQRDNIAGDMIPSAYASTGEQPPISPGNSSESPSVGGFVRNAFSSAGNLVGGLASAVAHPIKTAENVMGTVAGGAEKLFGVQNEDTQKFDNMVGYFKDRYGGDSFSHVLGNIAKTAYHDPAGMALDVSTLLDGVGAALGTVAKVGKFAELGDAAKTIQSVSSKLNPVSQGVKMVTAPINALADWIPNQILQSAVPQVKRAGTAESALNNLSFGTIGKNIVMSDLRKQSMYKSILSDIKTSGLNEDVGPGFAQHLMEKIREQFPDLGKTDDEVFKSLKTSAGTNGGIVDRILGGQFNLEDAYKLKTSLEENSYKLKIDDSIVKAGKDLAATAGKSIGDIIKEAVPSTEGKFADYAKEINWNKALKYLKSKGRSSATYKDILAFVTGHVTGLGGPAAVVLEKLASSPTVKLNVAKGLNLAKPLVKGGVKVARKTARVAYPAIPINETQNGLQKTGQ